MWHTINGGGMENFLAEMRARENIGKQNILVISHWYERDKLF